MKNQFKAFIFSIITLSALFGMVSFLIVFFMPEKLHFVSDSLSAYGAKGYRLPDTEHIPPPNTEADVRTLKAFSKVFVNIAKHARPALAYIEVQKTVTQRQSPFPFDDFFFPFMPPPGGAPGGGGKQRKGIQQGAGSGFIVDLKEGYVVTNNHVVEDADNILVVTFDDRKFKAEVKGTDKNLDVAVLKLEKFTPMNLKQVSFGDSDRMEVGDWVVALGAPFELPQTLTVGVVSALGRESDVVGGSIGSLIQTDAAINPGNSGGPLLNLDGEVIGINTAILSRTGNFAGIGFAVPSNMARAASEALINEGKVTRGFVGITMGDLKDWSPDTLKSLGLSESQQGAIVSQVVPDSPASKAGLKPYDVIVSVNGSPIQKASQLKSRVTFTKPGDTLDIGIIRDGKNQNIKIQVMEFNEETLKKFGDNPREPQEKNSSSPTGEFGVRLEPLTPELKQRFGILSKQGLVVLSVLQESLAGAAGLQRGDVIIELNRQKVKTVKDAEKILKASKNKELIMLIERQGSEQLILIRNH